MNGRRAYGKRTFAIVFAAVMLTAVLCALTADADDDDVYGNGQVTAAGSGPSGVPEYVITMVGGTVNGETEGTFLPGASITVKAGEAPEGKRFKSWVVEGIDMPPGLGLLISEITIQLPDLPQGTTDDVVVTVTAVFENIPEGSFMGDTLTLTVTAFAVVLACMAAYVLLIRRP